MAVWSTHEMFSKIAWSKSFVAAGLFHDLSLLELSLVRTLASTANPRPSPSLSDSDYSQSRCTEEEKVHTRAQRRSRGQGRIVREERTAVDQRLDRRNEIAG